MIKTIKTFKLVSLSLIFFLILTSVGTPLFNNKVSAESNEEYTEKDVEELAGFLEILFGEDGEKYLEYNDYGDFIGIKQEVLEEKGLSNQQHKKLINELEKQNLITSNKVELSSDNNISLASKNPVGKKYNPKWVKVRDDCLVNELKTAYGPAAFTAIYKYIKEEAWTKAAKKLLKLGIKGIVPGLISDFLWTVGLCADQANKKYEPFI